MMSESEQRDEEDRLNANEAKHLVVGSWIGHSSWFLQLITLSCKKHCNIELLEMCVQKFREGEIKLACKGYSAF